MNIVIVDYGMGNIRSLVSALKYVGAENIAISSSHETLRSADKLILPGVGAFGIAISQIKEKKLDTAIRELALEYKKPILGICLGMQLLGLSSDEDGSHVGIGLVNGDVRKFESTGIKIPHVGFNQVKTNNTLKLYKGFSDSADFYFTHSHRMTSNEQINQCTCTYGGAFIASFETGNIAGVQFHPELSQTNGLKLIRNFIELF